MVVGEGKALARGALHLVLLIDIRLYGDASGLGGELGGGAVFIGGTDVEDVMSGEALVAGEHISGQHRADKVPQMFDAIDIWQGRSDEDAALGAVLGHSCARSKTCILPESHRH